MVFSQVDLFHARVVLVDVTLCLDAQFPDVVFVFFFLSSFFNSCWHFSVAILVA